LIGVDLDNKIAIEEFCIRDGQKAFSLEELAQQTIVEQHNDDPGRVHVYFLSERPYAKKSSDVFNKKFDPHSMPAIEVKGDGEHGMLFCSPSIHRNGYRYEIIGTKVPAIVNHDYELHIDNICRKYSLAYLDDNTFESKVAGLVEPSHRNKEGHRHNTLAVINHYIYKNAYKLPEEQLSKQQLEDIILKYNREQNEPPLPDPEVDRMFHDALRRSTTRLKAEQAKIEAHHRKLQQQKMGRQQSSEQTDQRTKQDLIEKTSEDIIKTNRFLTKEESKEILYYDGNGVYVSGGEVLIEKEAERLLGYELSNKNLSEIKGHIMRRTYHKRSEIDADINIINLKNGLYNIETDELRPHSPDYLSINQKPITFNPKAKPNLFGKILA
jgi:hypothetical protein